MEKKNKNLESLSEKELWLFYAENKTYEIRNIIFLRYIDLLKKGARFYSTMYGYKMFWTYEDFISFGSLGLFKAIEKYNYREDVNFKSFAFTKIKGAIIDNIRTESEFNRGKSDFIKKLRLVGVEPDIFFVNNFLPGRSVRVKPIREFVNLQKNFAQKISYSSLADKLGISEKQLRIWIKIYMYAPMSSGDCSNNFGTHPSVYTPDNEFFSKEILTTVEKLIEELPEQERIFVRLFYWEEKSYSEIALEYYVTRSYVGSVLASARKNLLEKIKSDKTLNVTIYP